MKNTTFKFLVGFLLTINSFQTIAASTPPEDPKVELVLKMRHLKAQINSLDAQRELMQINFEYMRVLGNSLSSTSEDILNLLGIGIPEHRQGISATRKLGYQISELAQKNDPAMLAVSNQVRNNCMSCHAQEHPPGNINWNTLFAYDWSKVLVQCNEPGKNPYLCKSMHAMLSAYGFLYTAYNAKIHDFTATELAANELVRIFQDIKEKGFRHLSEEARAEGEKSAKELSLLARTRNPETFNKIPKLNSACTSCHNGTFHSVFSLYR